MDIFVLCSLTVWIPKDKENPYAVYQGREGGSIWIASAQDGIRVAEYTLPSPVVWDGMAAAQKKLFLSTMDGSVHCWAP